MAIASVIKYEGNNSTFVWKHPNTDFNTGSELIVHESQQAIFMANGEILDILEAGKHILETGNLPGVKRLQALATGGRVAFHAELYFVNLTEQMSIKWGTDSKIQYMDPEYNFPLEIGACGEMSLSVANSAKLLIKVVGTEKVLSREQLVVYFRAFLMNRIKSIFPAVIIDQKISIFNIDRYLDVISDSIKDRLYEDFIDYGVSLKSFLVTTVVKPDNERNYARFKELHYRRYVDVAEAELEQKVKIIEQQTKAQQTVIEAEAIARKRELEGYTYQQEKGFEVAREIARNDAISQMNNIGIGMGMMTGVGGSLGSRVGAMTSMAMDSVNPETKSPVFCHQCGKKLSSTAVFCDMCGTKVEKNQKRFCAKCGNELSVEAMFCCKCGTKVE